MPDHSRLWAIYHLRKSGKSEEEIEEMTETMLEMGYDENIVGQVIDAMRASYQNRDPKVMTQIIGKSQATIYRDFNKLDNGEYE